MKFENIQEHGIRRRQTRESLQFDIAVVGGGITGCTLAAELAVAGFHTVLLDAGTPGAQGATCYSGGIVRRYDQDPALMALGDYSLECMSEREVARRFGASVGRTGVLYAAPAHAEASLRESIDRYDRGRGTMQLIGHNELSALTPFLAPRDDRVVLHERDGGVADVRGSARSMVELLLKHGGMLLEHARVWSLQYESTHAQLSLGDLDIRAQVVVLASGGWLAEQLPELQLTVRSIPLLRTLASQPLALPVIDISSNSYAVPVQGRLVLTGTHPRRSATSPEALVAPPPAAVPNGLQKLGILTGHNEMGPVLDVLPGFDTYSADNRPVVGFLGKDDPRYVVGALSGIGYKLAPGIATLATAEIAERLQRPLLSRVPGELLRPFTPARLISAPSTTWQREAQNDEA